MPRARWFASCPPVTGHAGLNRVSWDLHYEPPRLVALRTTPPENPHIWEEPRFQGQETRADHPLGHRSRPKSGRSPAPGKYTLKMTVDGADVSRKPLRSRCAARRHGTEADLQAVGQPADSRCATTSARCPT